MVDLDSVSPEDREWLNTMDELAVLVKHPAWKVYSEQIIDVVIRDFQTMLLDSKTDDLGVIQAIRFMLKTLVKLRDRPQELLRTARAYRAQTGIPEPTEENDAINAG